MPLDLDDRRPTYLQLADDLRSAVASGEHAVGERLPAVRTIAQEYGVANATAARAIEVLQREGIVVSHPGRGTIVRDQAAAAAGAQSVQEQIDDLRRRVEALEVQRPRKA